MTIIRYDEFLKDKEFENIINEIFRIVESEGKWINDTTIEWDMSGEGSEPPQEEPNLIDRSIEKLKNFISKLDKNQVRNYYIKLVNKLKSLPERMRRFLITHYTSVFLSIVSFGFLINGEDETSAQQKIEQTIDPEIKKEIIELHKGSSFEEAQSAVKEVEAGYSDDRDDTGNWVDVPGFGKRFIGTNHGISAPILQKHLGKIPKREDMENLSYQTALEIYKKDYWDAQNLGMLCDQSVANIIYDGCVNQGVEGMSEVIKKAAKEQGININGNTYSKSNIRRLNSLDQQDIFNSIKKFREMRYKQAPTWYKHGQGWMNRLSSIEYQNSNRA